jgi:hypothetical protein
MAIFIGTNLYLQQIARSVPLVRQRSNSEQAFCLTTLTAKRVISPPNTFFA